MRIAYSKAPTHHDFFFFCFFSRSEVILLLLLLVPAMPLNWLCSWIGPEPATLIRCMWILLTEGGHLWFYLWQGKVRTMIFGSERVSPQCQQDRVGSRDRTLLRHHRHNLSCMWGINCRLTKKEDSIGMFTLSHLSLSFKKKKKSTIELNCSELNCIPISLFPLSLHHSHTHTLIFLCLCIHTPHHYLSRHVLIVTVSAVTIFIPDPIGSSSIYQRHSPTVVHWAVMTQYVQSVLVCIQWMLWHVISWYVMSTTAHVEDWFDSHTPIPKGMLALNSFGRPNHHHYHRHHHHRRKVRWQEEGDNCGEDQEAFHIVIIIVADENFHPPLQDTNRGDAAAATRERESIVKSSTTKQVP